MVFAQRDDGGDDFALLEAARKQFDFGFDEAFGLGGFALAGLEVVAQDLLHVVDVVEEGVFDLVDGGFDVAGDGQVDEEEGATTAGAHGAGHGVVVEDVAGGVCGGDDDIDIHQKILEAFEGAGLAAELCGERFGFGGGAVDDEEVGDALAVEVAGSQGAHFASADEEGAFSGEFAEDLAGQFDGQIGHADGVFADASFGADALGDTKGFVHDAVEEAANGLGVNGGLVGLFHLASDLGFANDHRVKAGDDAEDMP